MSILLCLSNTCLLQSIICKELSERIRNRLFHKCYHLIFNRCIILSKAYEGCLNSLSSVKSVKAVITECSCQLSCSVRTEIEEHYRIILFYCSFSSTVFCYNKWYNKLIRYIFIIRSLDSCCC